MKIAYLVNNGGEYSDYAICGIFDSTQKAQEWIDKTNAKEVECGKKYDSEPYDPDECYTTEYIIEEWPVNDCNYESWRI